MLYARVFLLPRETFSVIYFVVAPSFPLKLFIQMFQYNELQHGTYIFPRIFYLRLEMNGLTRCMDPTQNRYYHFHFRSGELELAISISVRHTCDSVDVFEGSWET